MDDLTEFFSGMSEDEINGFKNKWEHKVDQYKNKKVKKTRKEERKEMRERLEAIKQDYDRIFEEDE